MLDFFCWVDSVYGVKEEYRLWSLIVLGRNLCVSGVVIYVYVKSFLFGKWEWEVLLLVSRNFIF